MDLEFDACVRAFASRDARFDGRLFSGVTSTGIYCRPICPARTPKPENMRFFTSAAAAQAAGFRPCLRCRPETSPAHGAWLGTSVTVARALRLIEDGALDRAGVASLAQRLGVGERHLRRLFAAHLGASPIAVATTQRVLLAKQLVHETDLSMADVALASGLNSVRRFNEVFHALFGRPPASLRRGTRVPKDASSVVLRLAYRPPYDWDAILAFLASRAIAGVECVRGNSYARTIAYDGAHGTVTVQAGVRNMLQVTIQFPHLHALPAILERVRRVFDLAADPIAIARHLGADAALAPLVAARPGLRVPGAWDGFELASRAILGQQITVTAARTLASRLVAAYGEPLVSGAPDGLTHVFPQPERLAHADLTLLGMPRTRAAALSSLACAVVADPELFAVGRDLADAVARLRALPGIGEWTAQYIAMRELREPDAFPAADIGLMRALADASGRRPTPAELLARAQGWRPWRAYAALHLWSSEPKRRNAAA